MTQLTPADELTAAAQKLREGAAAASPGPWILTPRYRKGTNVLIQYDLTKPSTVVAGSKTTRAVSVHNTDLLYGVTMHPGVGLALADWLDETATEVAAAEGTEYELLAHEPPNSWTAALAVARQILGEQP